MIRCLLSLLESSLSLESLSCLGACCEPLSSLAFTDDVVDCGDNEKHRSQGSVNNTVEETVLENATASDGRLFVDVTAEDTVWEEKSDGGVASIERLPESVSVGTVAVGTNVSVVTSVVVTVVADMDSDACTVLAGITVEYTVLVDISGVNMIVSVDVTVEDRDLSHTSAQETDFVTSEDIVFVVTVGIQLASEAVIIVDDCIDPVVEISSVEDVVIGLSIGEAILDDGEAPGTLGHLSLPTSFVLLHSGSATQTKNHSLGLSLLSVIKKVVRAMKRTASERAGHVTIKHRIPLEILRK